jgi:hypothetical protein
MDNMVAARLFFWYGLEMEYFATAKSLWKAAFYLNVDVAAAKLFDFAPS